MNQELIKREYFKSANWAVEISALLQYSIEKILVCQNKCTVMLTGGSSAKLLYDAWRRNPNFQTLRNTHFFFGDERCVEPTHSDSNFKMTMGSLFLEGVPKGCKVYRMKGEAIDMVSEESRYGKLLPNTLDILLLSIGIDGHIASIFPNSSIFQEIEKKVSYVVSSSHAHNRLTITPKVIANAKHIFVLVIGRSKQNILEYSLSDRMNASAFPARLALGGTWFISD